MNIDQQRIREIIEQSATPNPYSGVLLIRQDGECALEYASGLANKADDIPNCTNTRFAMASGCKIFTAVAICQLIERGLFGLETRLRDCLDIRFPKFSTEVSVRHLLTHTSGIPDYFDEQTMEDYAALWKNRPMYNIRSPGDFLSMFQDNEMLFAPGEKFYYSGSGFIVLGLIIEQHTGMAFREYIEKNVFQRCKMTDSGYFATDQLPSRTAHHYIQNDDSTWKTNIFSVPAVGAPDGGAFTTAPDMARFWQAFRQYQLLGKEITEQLLIPHIKADSEGRNMYYGLGTWINMRSDSLIWYGVTGCDPGVAMASRVYPDQRIDLTMLGNTSEELWPIVKQIDREIAP